MIFRIRYQDIPSVPHVYCALYVAKGPNQTGAMCGTFTVRREEFEALQQAFPQAEFIKEAWGED